MTTTLTETRVCTLCARAMTVTIVDHDDYQPLNADIDHQFNTIGWCNNMCPPHAFLAR